MDIAIGIGLILALTVATGYFVAMEFAYVAVDRSALRNRAQNGDQAAKRALEITERLSFTLSGAQLGITATAILVGYTAEPYLGDGLKNIMNSAGITLGLSAFIATTATLFIATVVQMILGELAPKNWAIAKAQTVACILSRSTLIYLGIAGPIIRIFDAAATKILRSTGIEPAGELAGAATPEDLEHIIAESGEAGLLDPGTSRLLQRGLDFHDLTVRSAMIPRISVVTVNARQPAGALIELLDTGHTRFPVTGDGIDDLHGTVSITDLIAVPPAQRNTTTIGQLCNEAFILPETVSLPNALEHMRNQHHQFACITDEHGAFTGILTLEDIAEELVGEIRDEDDPETPTANEHADGSWTLPARWRLDELHDVTGIELPESDDYETLNGAILEALGRLPEVGDRLELLQVPPAALSDQPQRIAIVTVQSVEHGVADLINITSRDAVDTEEDKGS